MKEYSKALNLKSLYERYIAVIILFASLSIYSCKKYVQVDTPVTRIASAAVYSNNTSAAAVMSGVYVNMVSLPKLASGNAGISFLEGLAADELKNYASNITYSQFYKNALSSNNSGSSNIYFWVEIYQQIYVANAMIEGLANSTGVTATMKQQLDGEAKFIRAFYYFYAVNLYGDVPLTTTTDYVTNNTIQRTSKTLVYQQIEKDLVDAQAELNSDFVDASGMVTDERTRPNKGAAEALLARVYLYTGDWANAEAEADSVIGNVTNYGLLTDLTQVFKKNSMESIWQLQSVTGYNTWDAKYFVLTSSPSSNQPVALTTSLLSAFEPNDSRFTKWVNKYAKDSTHIYHYPFKYTVYLNNQPISEYLTVFRLAEQYLIRAEARAEQGNYLGSQDDLNAIRLRAGLPVTTATDQQSLLTAILHERQIELFSEWGHRWFDLIRTGNINSVMGIPGNVCQTKGGVWNPDWILAPLPLTETVINPNLTQNPGYN